MMRTATTTNPQLMRSFTPTHSLLLQRKCDCGNSAGLTGTCEACQKKRLQRQSTTQTEVSEVPPIVHEVLRSPGRPIDLETRQFMESRFDRDFSQVHVHTDPQVAQSAQAVNAVAYTLGQDIVFGSGQYAPSTQLGQRLLAHELTHVVQQAQASPADGIARQAIQISAPSDAAEQEADQMADAVVSGQNVTSKAVSSATTLQRACGQAEIGVPVCPDSPLDGAFVSGFPLFRFNVNCDDFAPGEAVALVNTVRALPANATIEIHGYASPDGPTLLNQKLACARALKAQSLLTTPGPLGAGITASRITRVVNHGLTLGPVADRRSVVIQSSTPPIPDPDPPAPEVPRTYVCSKELDRAPLGRHAFFRLGSPDPGNHTYSLQPEAVQGDCWQGIPYRDSASDMSATAICSHLTAVTPTMLEAEYQAYPVGRYCTLGPNSNTFVGHIMRDLGAAIPPGLGWTPGIDSSPPAPHTFTEDRETTLVADCPVFQCSTYRIEGVFDETDLLIISLGGTVVTAAMDVQVRPTCNSRSATSGRYGHHTELQVEPANPAAETLFGGSAPRYVPAPMLVCINNNGIHTARR